MSETSKFKQQTFGNWIWEKVWESPWSQSDVEVGEAIRIQTETKITINK